jgi:hypothetical protein
MISVDVLSIEVPTMALTMLRRKRFAVTSNMRIFCGIPSCGHQLHSVLTSVFTLLKHKIMGAYNRTAGLIHFLISVKFFGMLVKNGLFKYDLILKF